MILLDNLFRALSEAGSQVLLDSHKLKKGEIIWLGFLCFPKAIQIQLGVSRRGLQQILRTQGLIIIWLGFLCFTKAMQIQLGVSRRRLQKILRTTGLIIIWLGFLCFPKAMQIQLGVSRRRLQQILRTQGLIIIWLGFRCFLEAMQIQLGVSRRRLQQIFRTQGLTISLFYDVNPSEVSSSLKDYNSYKKSVLRHYSHPDQYPEEEIAGWKRALEEICSRSDWSMEIAGGFEALVKTVVKDVIETLDRVPLQVAKHPVGLDRVKKALIQKLNLNSAGSVVKAEIWGMGGIGKTTIAKAVYNEIYADFHAASFVFNVRSTATEAMGLATGLTRMQKKILKDLSKYGGEVDSVDEGISLFKDHLGGKRILLVLDDVDSKD
ncbi:disease resistance protein RUN1 [Cryptomeria japonica]|uniref:disease resistance protein RUN1 n=1 Tax=Cryptomeria japonica TaxID=3369 RepID=UPI0027DA9B3F|nr:disease resistance protein RUN1 [Cryptomeria japonica]